jgi:tRNA(Arg) A34 adenosine deaminase TadA
MCAGLMQQARIERCVYGAADPKGGALGSLYSIHEDKRLNHRFEVTAGLCASQSAALLKDFFGGLRSRKGGAKTAC